MVKLSTYCMLLALPMAAVTLPAAEPAPGSLVAQEMGRAISALPESTGRGVLDREQLRRCLLDARQIALWREAVANREKRLRKDQQALSDADSRLIETRLTMDYSDPMQSHEHELMVTQEQSLKREQRESSSHYEHDLETLRKIESRFYSVCAGFDYRAADYDAIIDEVNATTLPQSP